MSTAVRARVEVARRAVLHKAVLHKAVRKAVPRRAVPRKVVPRRAVLLEPRPAAAVVVARWLIARPHNGIVPGLAQPARMI